MNKIVTEDIWKMTEKAKNWQRIRAERIGIIAFVTTMQLQ